MAQSKPTKSITCALVSIPPGVLFDHLTLGAPQQRTLGDTLPPNMRSVVEVVRGANLESWLPPWLYLSVAFHGTLPVYGPEFCHL